MSDKDEWEGGEIVSGRAAAATSRRAHPPPAIPLYSVAGVCVGASEQPQYWLGHAPSGWASRRWLCFVFLSPSV